jgi:phenylpropionate dioxygenase-like ring-hydroxylating dioxygenase large terminal subunit
MNRATAPAPASSTGIATAATPFIHNAWYVAAEARELSRTPIARTLLGTSVVLFRKTDGTVVALQNRCAHRSFPLVHGTLEGDTLVCGYHGLRYDCSGRCIEIPMQKSVPAAIKVRAYLTREIGPFVWIWMGNAERGAGVEPPHQEWMDAPQWAQGWAYLKVRGSYVHLHENLLDLSHLSFLHAKTFGTPEYARAPVEMHTDGGELEVWRHVECVLPPIYSKPLGWSGMKARRSSGSKFVSPGLHVNSGLFVNLEQPQANPSPQPMIRVAQLITPETSTSTHYWTLQARNFAVGDREMGEFMIKSLVSAFEEDAFALGKITEMHELEADHPFAEISIPTDRAGVMMRRLLKKLADEETEDCIGTPQRTAL